MNERVSEAQENLQAQSARSLSYPAVTRDNIYEFPRKTRGNSRHFLPARLCAVVSRTVHSAGAGLASGAVTVRELLRPMASAVIRVGSSALTLGHHAAARVSSVAADAAGRTEIGFYRWLSRKKLLRRGRVNSAILLAAVCIAVFCSSFYTVGLEVLLDGHSIGFVSSQAEFEQAIQSVSARAGEILQYPYQLSPNVQYQFSIVDRRQVFHPNEVQEELFSQISQIKKLYVLRVDGKAVAAHDDPVVLKSLVDNLLASHPLADQAYASSFVQNVRMDHAWTDASLERTVAELEELLASPVRDASTAALSDGQTALSLAAQNGMSLSELQSLNADVNFDSLQSGDILRTRKPVPFLSILALEHTVYTESVPFDTSMVDDATIYEGDTRVKVKGVPGVASVNADLRYVDGELVEQVEVSREIVTAPITEVIAVGTKIRPPKAPTGTFIRPFWGKLTSDYGYRRLFGQTEFHPGVDFAGPTGSPIVASDGGVVVFAGTKSGYGLTVIVSHGNNLRTLYGHCSKLLVSVGQEVGQGELIAKVGNTGRSTGPHLHFEIQVNGQHQNPWNYLKK